MKAGIRTIAHVEGGRKKGIVERKGDYYTEGGLEEKGEKGGGKTSRHRNGRKSRGQEVIEVG